MNGVSRNGRYGGYSYEPLAKPNNGHMRLINPLAVIGQEERKLLDAKREIIKSNSAIFDSENITNLKQLLNQIDIAIGEAFPNAGYVLLARQAGNYTAISQRGIEFDPKELNLSTANSIVKTAGEIEPGERRTVYIPDLSQNGLYLASKFDEGFARDHHDIEEGTIEGSGLTIDLFSLARAKIPAVAVAPSMERTYTDPVAAIMLVGSPSFLNPFVDLVPLRELADSIARPLKAKLHQ